MITSKFIDLHLDYLTFLNIKMKNIQDKNYFYYKLYVFLFICSIKFAFIFNRIGIKLLNIKLILDGITLPLCSIVTIIIISKNKRFNNNKYESHSGQKDTW